ncbi:hypothetical protein GOP47_0026830 [Adiantum capillus-veneris]|nr:hypothetical protein GOP47_0026830 [Adiantum capillus-veneris]
MATSRFFHASVVGDDPRSQLTPWVSSVTLGILACKTIYNVMKAFSPLVPHYSKLSKAEKVEWDNRGFSTAHSVAISAAAMYFIFISSLYKDDAPYGPVVFRSSLSSQFTLGMSVGYFISDLGMIVWFYPALGGKEYIVHHGLSMVSLALPVYSGEGSFYVYMMLLSESTTPFVNLRWYLSIAGLKNSRVYVINGVLLFLGWMVARILLFVFFFIHLYNHYDQVQRMSAPAYYCLLVVPPCFAILNLAWFIKVIRGLLKTFFKKV